MSPSVLGKPFIPNVDGKCVVFDQDVEDEDEELVAQLDERIQEHVENLKAWRIKTQLKPLSIHQELQETKNNLLKVRGGMPLFTEIFSLKS